MSGIEKAERAKLVLVTGLSGSGKSTVANCLEDLGYFVADNLPLALLEQFLADPQAHSGGRDRIAVVADLRCAGFDAEAPRLWQEIDRRRLSPMLVFLDSSEPALVRRFSESRRPHPLGSEMPIAAAISRERELLAELRDMADRVLDTSEWSTHEMRSLVYREFGRESGHLPEMTVSVVSFGFKHGLPNGADLVFDVRFLNNPYYVDELRGRTGLEEPVIEFLAAQPDFGELLTRLDEMVGFLLPRYRQENRAYLTLAIGCTGGQHRSVAVAERLADRLRARGWEVGVRHRELEKGRS
ncbi:MAG: RNase adapter RapZ [Thermoanaerobaculia bacterium]|nr:RNase adapter RapZ [Thermoanaerobaculia bacterium]